MSDPSKVTCRVRQAQDSSLSSRIAEAFVSGTWGDTPQAATTFKAFISYKHAVSSSFALRLEQALKAYAKPLLARPIRIFRDEKHFAPGIDLPKLIVDALNVSEFLILLASPEAADSPWVRDELVHWCGELKRTPKIIIVLVNGEIASNNETKQLDWTSTSALPAMLEPYLAHVPLYLDMRSVAQVDDLSLSNPDFKKAVNGITARFRGIDPNEMLGEEIHQHCRNLRLRNGAAAALLILTLASMIAAYVAVTQREQALQQARIALSRQYAAEAANLMENNLDEAILRAVNAAKTEQTFEGRNLLFQTLTYSPEIEAFLYREREENEEDLPPASSFNPVGNQIALATADTLQLFDLTEAAGPTNRRVHLSVGYISSVAYSHSGSILAVGGNDGRISLVNTSQWKTITTTVKITDHPVDRLFFSATDDRLFAVSAEQAFRLSVSDNGLSLAETVQIRDPSVRNWAVQHHVPDPTTSTGDGRFLVTGIGTSIVVWDLSGPIRQRYSFDVRHRFHVVLREVAVSPGGEKLAVDLVASSDGIPLNFVQLYSIEGLDAVSGTASFTLQRTFTTRRYLSFGSRLAFNNMGDHLLIGDIDATFQLINLKVPAEQTADDKQEANSNRAAEIDLTGSIRRCQSRGVTISGASVSSVSERIKVKGLSGEVYGPRFAPDDNRVLLGFGGRIILWNPRLPQIVSRTLITHDHSPIGLAFSRDGGKLVLATGDGSIHRLNIPGGAPEVSTVSVAGRTTAFLTEDGSRLAVVRKDQISFNDTITGAELRNFGLEGWTPLAMSPDGRFIAQFREGMLRVINTFTFSEVWRTQLYDKRRMRYPLTRNPGVSFSKDGARMVVHDFEMTKLTVWDATSGRRLNVFDTGAKWDWDRPPAISPDGIWIAAAASPNGLVILNTLTQEATTIKVPRGDICNGVFSPDSAHLAVSHEEEESDSGDVPYYPADYSVLFWDLSGKRWESLHIKVPTPPCHGVFSPAGDRLAIATSPERYEQSQVLVWDIDSALWIKSALRRIMYSP